MRTYAFTVGFGLIIGFTSVANAPSPVTVTVTTTVTSSELVCPDEVTFGSRDYPYNSMKHRYLGTAYCYNI
jgi:hypothetical protein